jgi:3-deoxy-manno-octulosonate cytidylyltransferase (CMP-KDO synthetase)
MRAIGVIPCRYGSTRLPAKALLPIAGKPMVQHVYERASAASCLAEVIIATDDERIADAVHAFGGQVQMTATTHQSGTDRVAEVAARSNADVIVNIQGDEVMIDPRSIEAAVAPFLGTCPPRIGTLACRITSREEWLDPAAVKVIVDRDGDAIYFSRSPIPFFRLEGLGGEAEPLTHPLTGLYPLKHLGLYVYTREALMWFSALEPTPIEMTERLGQLRALENGCRIRVVEVAESPIGVDTPEDLATVRRILEGGA